MYNSVNIGSFVSSNSAWYVGLLGVHSFNHKSHEARTSAFQKYPPDHRKAFIVLSKCARGSIQKKHNLVKLRIKLLLNYLNGSELWSCWYYGLMRSMQGGEARDTYGVHSLILKHTYCKVSPMFLRTDKTKLSLLFFLLVL